VNLAPERCVLVATRGLPGAGKTTWARDELARLRAAGVRAARLSRDDTRGMLGLDPATTTEQQEDEVTTTHHSLIRALVAAGMEVVILDDTHLHPEHLRVTSALAKACGAQLRVHDMRHVPVQTCIEHDATRTGTAHLGADRIHAMATAAGMGEGSEGLPR
jgi:predicted kinase